MKDANHIEVSRQPSKLAAWLGLALSAVASLCCVIPLMLVTVGITGTWIGSLSVFAPLKPYSLALGAIAILWAIWLTTKSYRRACEDESCSRPKRRVSYVLIGMGAIIWLVAATDFLWINLIS